jgi:L-threonylcarbamoyladenylate synthase
VAPERILLSRLGTADAPGLEARVAAAALVCFPTDTVYGVGGALTPAVTAALVAAKGRAAGKPLQVVFGGLDQLEAAVPMAPVVRAACRRLLPGPLTLVVPYPEGWTFPPPGGVADAPAGKAGASVATLGVRVPAWPPAARCLAALAHPLVASSANPSGGLPPATLDEVDAALLARCDLVLDGGRVAGAASSVVDLSGYAATGRWRLLRRGAWDEAAVAARLRGEGEEGPRP